MKIFKKLYNWWLFRRITKEFDKEVDENLDVWFNQPLPEILQEEKQQKYFQGLLYLKDEVKRKANGSFHSYLLSLGDSVFDLARRETKSEEAERKFKESIYIYKGQDIKSSEDMKKMIDKRINHYYELQRNKETRELLKQCRKAYKEGNLELHNKLKQEIEDMYGRLRQNKS